MLLLHRPLQDPLQRTGERGREAKKTKRFKSSECRQTFWAERYHDVATRKPLNTEWNKTLPTLTLLSQQTTAWTTALTNQRGGWHLDTHRSFFMIIAALKKCQKHKMENFGDFSETLYSNSLQTQHRSSTHSNHYASRGVGGYFSISPITNSITHFYWLSSPESQIFFKQMKKNLPSNRFPIGSIKSWKHRINQITARSLWDGKN